MPLPSKKLIPLINRALKEDIGPGDVTTTAIIPDQSRGHARWVAKDEGVIAGLFVGKWVFEQLDESLEWNTAVGEGEKVQRGQVIVEFKAKCRALLTAERTALNFVQRISGIATVAASYAAELRGTSAQLLDTRKTVPGLRLLDKYAVTAGGGTNHRAGLYDMVLIKENHIQMGGGIAKAVQAVRTHNPNITIEVETTNCNEVTEALSAGANIIMLDNMSIQQMKQAVQLINGRAKTEASGNVTMKCINEIAACGVDYISVGALTHSVSAFDISQLITET